MIVRAFDPEEHFVRELLHIIRSTTKARWMEQLRQLQERRTNLLGRRRFVDAECYVRTLRDA